MAPWLMLTLAICSEVIGTSALRASEGFTRPVPIAVTAVTYALSFYLLALVMRHLDLSLTYAIWSGAGTAAIAAVGVLWFGEGFGAVKAFGIALVIAGVVVVNLADRAL
ncbi:DMT family transporter [Capillimicrobium parvum]|nr:multidrug efflux SMR transporter [Capillimicrobium parvum]